MLSTHPPIPFFDFTVPVFSWFSGSMANFLLAVFFVLFSALECRFPRNKLYDNKLFGSYAINIGLFTFNSMVLSLASVSSLLLLAEQHSNQWLLVYLPNPLWKSVLSFLLFDLSLYLWHWMSHRFDNLWRFHRVHHSDPVMNVSTAFRLHLLDITVITFVKASYTVLFGFDKVVVLTNEIINMLFLMFHHSNLTFKGERLLSYVFIVPYLHRTHHSRNRQEHDSNYGAVLSVWDRLFGTFAALDPKGIGIKGDVPQDIIGLFLFGLGLKVPLPTPGLSVEALETMIAEAAYYKAERRNFYPGHEIHDWLEAKREIIRQVYGDKATGIQRKDNPPIF